MRYGRRFGFTFGLPPFRLWFGGPGFFPRRKEYIQMLEDYKKELEEELKELKKES